MWKSISKVCLYLMVVVASTSRAQSVERPRWHKGDAWTYKVLTLPAGQFPGTIETREVFSISEELADGYEVLIRTHDANDALTEEWRGHNSLDASPMTKSTPNGAWGEARWPEWPLKPETDRKYSGKQSDETSFTRETTIGGWEEVSVPAGRFRALRIDIKFTKGYFFSHETWWFASEVKRYVRFEQRYRFRNWDTAHMTWELLSYTLK